MIYIDGWGHFCCEECTKALAMPPPKVDLDRVKHHDSEEICPECGQPLTPDDLLSGNIMHPACENTLKALWRWEKKGRDPPWG